MYAIIVFFNDPLREIAMIGPLETERATQLEADRLDKMYENADPKAVRSIVWKKLTKPGALLKVK
jgi:hypothetical protein